MARSTSLASRLCGGLGLILSFILAVISATLVIAQDTSSSHSWPPNTTIDPDLYTKALNHAKSMNLGTSDSQLIEQLQSGNIDTIYTVAQSMNRRDGEDRITSVKIWHALADGPARHVLSAVALGFSYAEVDKEMALQYFIQAAEGKQGDGEVGPHQAAMFNAGRIFLELNDAPSSLAYIRGCANLSQSHAEYSSPELTKTCKDAYETLSAEIMKDTTAPPGIEDAAEMFLYSSINDFPTPTSKEFQVWHKAMGYLESYAQLLRGDEDLNTPGSKKQARKELTSALKELENFQSQYSGEKCRSCMSELQDYLLRTILVRLQFLLATLDEESRAGDEL